MQREEETQIFSDLFQIFIMFPIDNTTTTTSTNITLRIDSLNILHFFFHHIYLLLLVIIGIIGNTLVIIVFGQRTVRSSINSNLSVYPFLFYMAISDTIYLIILFCLWLSNYVNILHRPIICQMTLYLTYVCNFINAYYTVSFTAQRLFAVIEPFRVSHVLSWHRSRSLALSIIAIACLIYLYLPFLVGIVDGYCYSLERYRWINKFMDILDCIIVFLIPYLIIISMNTIIVITLKRTQHILLYQTNSHWNKLRLITRRNASRKMTKLLLTVSTAYLIICAPYACIHTYRLLYEDRFVSKRILRQLEYYSHFIYHLSFVMNFYLYFIFGSKFRRELKRLLMKYRWTFASCCRKENINQHKYERNHSSNCEQLQCFDPTLTTAGIAFQYRWRYGKGFDV